MLFDLRSKRRRGAVKVIYVGLALLIGGGLVLFGVGAGNGNGGLLNGLSNGGNGSSGNSLAARQVRTALQAVKASPSSASAWGNLVQQYWAEANQSPNLQTSSTGVGVFTSAGRADLLDATKAYQKYTTLAKTPNPNVVLLAARAYVILKNWSPAASAWETIAQAESNSAQAFECMALTSYAGGQTPKGDLAYQKAVSLFPKASKFELSQQLKAAKANPTAYAAQDC
jgi:hypothetical protein